MYNHMDLKGAADEFDGHQKKPPPPPPPQPHHKHFHVLAVDDSLIDRKLLEKLLTVSSYQVTCVDSGDKALEYLGLLENTDNDSTPCSSPPSSQQDVRGSKVNLIMTDYSMPGMSGYDLLQRVKGSCWKDVPVVVMSSENVPSRINMCLEGGAEEFLLKPVKLSDLTKLQSHLLNSLGHSCTNSTDISDDDDNHLAENCSISRLNTDDDGNNHHDNSTNCSVYKRKATSPQQPERRPKIIELIGCLIEPVPTFSFAE